MKKSRFGKVIALLLVAALFLGSFGITGHYQVFAAEDTSAAVEQATDESVDTADEEVVLKNSATQDTAVSEDATVTTESTQSVDTSADQSTADEDSDADVEEAVESDDIATTYTKDLAEVTVKAVTEDGAFDEEVELVVKQLAETSKDYKDAAAELEKEDVVYDGMIAYDIHFKSVETGKEVEPNGTVSVDIKAKEKGLKAIDAENFDKGSVQITHIGSDKTEVVADNDAASDVEGTVKVNANDTAVKEIKAEFDVESFSTFVLTWGENNSNSATIHFGTRNGTTFEEFAEETINFDTSATSINIANKFDGYTYYGATYCTNGQSIEQGVDMDSIINKTSSGWQITQYTKNESEESVPSQTNIANGSHIYAEYFVPGSPNPSGAGDDKIPSPTTTKTVTSNGDGTYTIQLDVTGATVTQDNSHYANILVILDATRSMNGAKWTNAKAAMKTLVETLCEGENAANAGKIDFALVTFGRSATVTQDWTKDNVAFKQTCADLNMVTTSGTNWEAGMRGGLYGVLNDMPDNDPTFVIFLTDGDPNVYYNSGSATNYTNTGTTDGWSQNSNTSATHSADEAKSIAAKTKLYGIYCGDSGTTPSGESYNRLVSVITGQGQGGVKTIAANADTIQKEFKTIAETALQSMGANNASVDDGVTSLSSVSARTVGEAGAFEYYIATKENPSDSDFSTWTDAPGASYSNDNGVTWDLSKVGTLPEKTTYRLKFTVWPSQAALDTVADLNNDLLEYEDLDEDVKSQIIENTDGSYSLLTNTHLNTSYTFNNTEYTDVNDKGNNAMTLDVEEFTVKKIWNNDLDGRSADSVKLIVTKDGENYLYGDNAVEVSKDSTPAWVSDTVYISCGYMTQDSNGYVIKETGHDYTVKERADDAYYWDLTADVYHPMVINGTPTMLILDEAATGTDGTDYYTIKGHKYIKTEGENQLTATNDRRSYLNLTKTVTGEGADPDQLFEYTATVGKAGEDDIWFSVDSDDSTSTFNPVADKDFTHSGNVTAQDGTNGYYYVKAGEQFTVSIKAGWNIRFINLPTGTTYSIAETADKNYPYDNAKATANGEVTTDATVTNQTRTVTGTIATPNTDYTVTYTNKFDSTSLSGTKTWNDNNNKAGKRAESISITLQKLVQKTVDGVTSEVWEDVKTLTVTENENWGYKFDNLTKYAADGTAIVYRIVEAAVEDYLTTYSAESTKNQTPGGPYTINVTNTNVTVDTNTEAFFKKTVTNPNNVKDATFKFTLTEVADADGNVKEGATPKEGTVTFAKEETGSKAIDFGEIVYSKEGTYYYKIQEIEKPAGWTASPESVIVSVQVKLVDGELVATPSGGEIENNYNLGTTDITLSASKTLEVASGDNAPDVSGKYTLTLKDANGETIDSQVNPDGNGTKVDFEKITYSTPGTYKYTVEESGTVPGVTNGTTSYEVEVTVTDNGDGTMSAAVTKGNQVTGFTNTYKVGTTDITLGASKTLEVESGDNAPDVSGKYTLTLKDANGETIDSKANPDGNGTKVDFEEITYSAPGTYKYTVEESGTVPGVTNGTTSYEVEVTVTDNGDGTMSAAVTKGNQVTGFTNTYKVGTTDITLGASKTLEVASGDNAPDVSGKYTLTLKDADGKELSSKKNPDGDGTPVNFDKITFTAPGEYKYTVTEEGEVAGVSNGVTSYEVVVTVTDNGDGTLTAKVTKGDQVTAFTNTYKVAPAKITLGASKTLEVASGNNAPDVSGEYTLTLKDANGETIDSQVNPDGEGTAVNFKELSFDAPGEYAYTVTEEGEVAGVTNGTSSYDVVITVTDNGDGTMTAEVTEGKAVTAFTNTYSVEPTTAAIPVEKILEVDSDLTAPDIKGQYTFELEGVSAPDGVETVPVPEVTSYTNPDKDGGSVSFGDIIYSVPGTYTYKVTESGEVPGVNNDSAAAEGKTVTVTVVDNGNGTLTATPSVTENAPLQFTNTYSVDKVTATIPVVKILKGAQDNLKLPDITEEYTFTLAAVDGAPLVDKDGKAVETELKNPSATGGSVTFGAIAFDKPGTYQYTITESGEVAGITNDKDASKTIEVVVTDNSDGTMSAVVNDGKEVEFTNTYDVKPTTASFPVKKEISVPEGLKGPAEWSYNITVAANDGAPVAETMTGTVTNKADTVTFGDFTYTAPGTYTYTVSETGTVAGVTNDTQAAGKTVTVTVVDNGNGTLTATPSSTTDEPLKFTNTYSVKPTTANFPVQKIMSVPAGMTGPESWSYTINVAENGQAPAAETMTGTVTKANDTVAFGPFDFSKPGTYTYTVSESGTVKGVTNDKDAAGKTVTVTVVDNQDGTLTATADSTTDKPLTFTNTYNTEPVVVETTAMLEKTVEKMPPATESVTFDFTIAAGDNTAVAEEGETVATPLPVKDGKENTTASATFTKAETQDVDFGTLTFTKPGTYNYTFTEDVSKLDGGWTTTGNPVNVQIVVTDEKDGSLKAEVKTKSTITNTFETVVVDGIKSWNDAKYFDENGEPLNGYERPAVTINLMADGKKIDSKTVTAADNWKYSFKDLPKYKEHGTQIVYTIEEVKPEGFTDPVVTGYNVENTPVPDTEVLNPTSFEILKTDAATGGAIGTGAEFTLYKGEEAVDTYTTGENGRAIVEFKQGGHEDGTYTLKETKAPEGYEASDATFTIVVDKEFNIVRLNANKTVWEWVYDLIHRSENAEYKDGVLTVPNTPILTKFTAEKVWNDNNDKDKVRPGEIKLTLTGTAGDWSKTYDQVTVKADDEGNWSYAWDKLEGYHNGTKISYEVTEAAVAEYATTYSDVTGDVLEDAEAGYSQTVTNSHQSHPEKHVFTGTDETYIDGQLVQPGQELTYEITYVNTTGTTVEKATITDKIPDYTTYVEGSAKVSEGAAETDAIDDSGSPITWTFTNVPDGAKKVVTFTVKVNDNTDGATKLSNTGNLNDGTNDLDTNEVVNTVPVKDVFKDNVSIKQVVTEDGEEKMVEVKKGDILTYTITYENATEEDVEATITDKVPNNTKYVAGTAKVDTEGYKATIDDSTDTITWSGMTVPVGGKVTVSFQVQVLRNNGVTVENTGEVVINDGPAYKTTPTKNTTPEYLDLDVSKAVDVYEDGSPTTFVFSVKAYDAAGAKVYDDIVTLTFSAATTRTATLVEVVPKGGRVEVEEIYGGADYKLASEGSVAYTDYTEKQTASFTNTYDDTINRGYGIMNKYTTPDGINWPDPDNSGDSQDASPENAAE